MRKIMNIFAAALVMLAAISCEKNETLPDNSAKGPITLTAVIDNGGTKTSLGAMENGEYPVLWSDGDAIKIIQESQSYIFYLTDGAGKTSGSFRCPDETVANFNQEEDYIAGYPLSNVRVNGEIVQYNIPDTQNYAENSFGSGAMPMAASSTGGTAFTFNNLFGVLKLQLKGVADEKVTSIVITSGDALNGVATLTEGVLELQGTEDENKKVTLDCSANGGVVLNPEEATNFHIALPPGATDLGVMIHTTKASYYKAVPANNIIKTGSILKMDVLNTTDLAPAYIANGVYYGDGVELPKSATETLIWAPVNCGYDEDHKYGLLYQWGRKDGSGYNDETTFIETPVQTYHNGAYEWDGVSEILPEADKCYFYNGDWISIKNDNLWFDGSSTTSKTQYDPCPEGWRVPTIAELITLVPGLTEWEESSVTGFSSRCETIDDPNDKYYRMSGFWFYGNTAETTGNKVFFPAGGILSCDDKDGAVFMLRHELGSYYSSSTLSTRAWYLSFFVNEDSEQKGVVKSVYTGRNYGRSVRCVKDSPAGDNQ